MKTGYCDVMVNDLDEALRILKNAVRKREATSALSDVAGNCADVIPELARRGVVPDLLTDQTSAHDPIGGYIPQGLDVAQAAELRKSDPESYRKRSLESIGKHVEGMLALQKLGSITFDYGNNIRTFAFEQGVKNAYDFPWVRTCVYSPAFLRRAWVLSVGLRFQARLRIFTARINSCSICASARRKFLTRWIHLAQKRVRFQGLPGANLAGAGLRRARQIRARAE